MNSSNCFSGPGQPRRSTCLYKRPRKPTGLVHRLQPNTSSECNILVIRLKELVRRCGHAVSKVGKNDAHLGAVSVRQSDLKPTDGGIAR